MFRYLKNKIYHLINYLKYLFYLLRTEPFRLLYLKVFNPKIFLNKSIAVIGPADSAFKHNNGEFIDSFDLVIRINFGVRLIEEFKKQIGTKTSIVVIGIVESIDECIDFKLWKDSAVKMIIYPANINCGVNRNIIYLFKKMKNNFYKFLFQPSKFYYDSIRERISSSHPNSGFSAICYALEYGNSDVFITGFTFYRTPYQKEYAMMYKRDNNLERIVNGGFHNPNNDFELFKKFCSKYSDRIIVDKDLYEIMRSEGILLREIRA